MVSVLHQKGQGLFDFHLYKFTRGPVHGFVHRCGPSAWPAIEAYWGAGLLRGGAAGGWLWERTDLQGAAPVLSAFPPSGQCAS